MSTLIIKKFLPLNQLQLILNGRHQPSSSLSDLDIPIAFRKGNRSCTNHPISKFIFYDHLNLTFHQFALSVSSDYIPRSCEEALLVHA